MADPNVTDGGEVEQKLEEIEHHLREAEKEINNLRGTIEKRVALQEIGAALEDIEELRADD